jgi:hypothetical protein
MRGAATLLPRPTPGVAGRASRHLGRPRRLLMVCALLSALGHAALLVNWQDGGGGSGAGASTRRALPPTPEPASVSTVRLLDGPSVLDVAATAPEPRQETAPIATHDETPPARPAAAPDAHTEADAIARAGTANVGNGAHDGDDHGDGDDRYLTRSQLDQPPAAQADIALAFPDTAPLGRYRAVLTLFIDATGQVQRVRTESAEGPESTEGASLPPSLDNAARQAFLAARFTPGVKDGQPVRSRIRVEVVYSTELLPQRSASAGVAGGESAP